MRDPQFTLIFILSFCMFTSCDQESLKTSKEIKPGSGEYYFQQGIDSKEPSKMLAQFKNGLDSAKIENDTIEFYLLDGVIYTYNRLKEYDSSLVYSEKMIDRAKNNDKTYFEALGYYRKAIIHQYLNNYKEKYRNAFISRKL